MVFILLNCFLRISTIKYSNKLKASFSYELSRLAYKKIIYSNYEYYIKTTSSKIITDLNESIRRSAQIISLFIDGISSVFSLTFLILSLLIISKEITFVLFIFVSLTYITIAKVQNNTIKIDLNNLTAAKQKQTEIIQETLGSKKDIVLRNNQSLFINNFSESSFKTEFAISAISNAAQIPKYLVEFVYSFAWFNSILT